MSAFRPLDEEAKYEGWAITVVKARFEGPDGIFERDIVRHPGAVAVVPLIDDDVILVRQYRAALDRDMLEIPAGIRDVDGEPTIETARREMGEEIGMTPGSIEPLTIINTAIGFTDEQIDIFVATDLSEVEQPDLTSPEERQMDVLRVPLANVEQMILSGEITDCKTVVALLHILRR